jgi:hypothetical protein
MTAINITATINVRLPEFLNMSFTPGLLPVLLPVLLLIRERRAGEIIAQLGSRLLHFSRSVFNPNFGG